VEEEDRRIPATPNQRNLFQDIESHIALIRTQMGGSSRGMNNATPSPSERASPTPLFNSHNIATQIISAFTFVTLAEVASSLQVSSDSAVQEEQFRINNPNPSLYVTFLVPDSLSTGEDSFTKQETLHYETTWENKTVAYTFEENDSDNDETIDEARRQLRLQKA
ncbi:23118_t:CDS:2, partial [Gigaspora rosea]